MSESANLVCSICNNDYTVKRRDPRLLRCLHAVCEPCLKTQRDVSSMTCRTCHAEGSGEGGTPVDYVRLNEHIMFMAKHNPDRLKCTNQNDGKNGRMYCFECNHFLCDQCVCYHSQLEATKNHLSVYLGDLTSHPLTEWQTKEKCSSHPDYPVSLFCHESSCRKLICLYCFTKEHSGHNTQDIEEAYEIEKEDIVKLTNHIRSRISTVRDLISQKAEILAMKTRVRDMFDRIRDEVSRRRIVHKQIIDDHYGVADMSPGGKMRYLKAQASKLKDAYEKTMSFRTDPQYKALERDVDLARKPRHPDSELVFKQNNLTSVLQSIETFGKPWKLNLTLSAEK